jgi:RNA polymerase sigma-70 factor, ECF subfamily
MELNNELAFGLLKQIAEGNQAALTKLYKALSRKIYAFALNQLKNPGEAEEIVVDTMHEVWKNPSRFRGESKFTTWVLGIARYKILSAYRSRDPEYDELDESLPALEAGAFELLAQKQRREGVRRCMDKLPDEQRECLHFVFYEGLSLAEVASLQDCPENTVKTRLFHARQKIKNCLRLVLEREGKSD